MTEGDIVYINWKGANTKTYFVRESFIPGWISVKLADHPKGEILIPLNEVNNDITTEPD